MFVVAFWTSIYAEITPRILFRHIFAHIKVRGISLHFVASFKKKARLCSLRKTGTRDLHFEGHGYQATALRIRISGS